MKSPPPLTVFVKGKSFLPDTVSIMVGSHIVFKNEDSAVYIIQCKGSSHKIPDIKLRRMGSSKVHFPIVGRYELTSQNDSSIKFLVEVKGKESLNENVHRRNISYFESAAVQERTEVMNPDKSPSIHDAVKHDSQQEILQSFTNSVSKVTQKQEKTPSRNPPSSNQSEYSPNDLSPIDAKMPKVNIKFSIECSNQFLDKDSDSEDEEVENLLSQRRLYKKFLLSADHQQSPVRSSKKLSIASDFQGSPNKSKTTVAAIIESSESIGSQNLPPQTHVVLIEDFDFEVHVLNVNVGDTIAFSLSESVPIHAEHVIFGISNVSSLNFESGVLQKHEENEFTFIPIVSGEIDVSCRVYSDMFCRINVHLKSVLGLGQQIIDEESSRLSVLPRKYSSDSFYDSDDCFSDEESQERKQSIELSTEASAASSCDHTVIIDEFSFRPEVLQCSAGEKVKFVINACNWYCKIACDGVFQQVILDQSSTSFTHQFKDPGVFEVYNEIFSFVNCRVQVKSINTAPATSAMPFPLPSRVTLDPALIPNAKLDFPNLFGSFAKNQSTAAAKPASQPPVKLIVPNISVSECVRVNRNSANTSSLKDSAPKPEVVPFLMQKSDSVPPLLGSFMQTLLPSRTALASADLSVAVPDDDDSDSVDSNNADQVELSAKELKEKRKRKEKRKKYKERQKVKEKAKKAMAEENGEPVASTVDFSCFDETADKPCSEWKVEEELRELQLTDLITLESSSASVAQEYVIATADESVALEEEEEEQQKQEGREGEGEGFAEPEKLEAAAVQEFVEDFVPEEPREELESENCANEGSADDFSQLDISFGNLDDLLCSDHRTSASQLLQSHSNPVASIDRSSPEPVSKQQSSETAVLFQTPGAKEAKSARKLDSSPLIKSSPLESDIELLEQPTAKRNALLSMLGISPRPSTPIHTNVRESNRSPIIIQFGDLPLLMDSDNEDEDGVVDSHSDQLISAFEQSLNQVAAEDPAASEAGEEPSCEIEIVDDEEKEEEGSFSEELDEFYHLFSQRAMDIEEKISSGIPDHFCDQFVPIYCWESLFASPEPESLPAPPTNEILASFIANDLLSEELTASATNVTYSSERKKNGRKKKPKLSN